jgi:hypothetical protein
MCFMLDPMDAARRAKTKVAELVTGRPEVNGIGITRVGERYAVKVNLRQPLPANVLPRTVEDVPVVVELVGAIKALTR